MGFEAITNGVRHAELMEIGAVFYEAEIHMDAILSYPWMVEHKIAVFPHKRALALDLPVLTLLYGLPESLRGKKRISSVSNLENASEIECEDTSDFQPSGDVPQAVNKVEIQPEGVELSVPLSHKRKKRQKKSWKKSCNMP